MSLDGLRAWIGEVERKLGMRTKVMLVLAAIAIGAAGTAIYLVIDYRDKAVSESDIQRLQEELGAGAGTGSEVAGLQAEIDALEAQVEELRRQSGGKGARGGKGGAGAGKGGAAGGGGTPSPTPSTPGLPDTGSLPSTP